MSVLEVDLGHGRRLLPYRGVTGNSYLVADDRSAHTVMVDCGMPADLPGLLALLKRLPPLERVVCTHFHIDHVSGWHGLKRRFPDLSLWFRRPARPWVCGEKRLPPPGLAVMRDLFLPVMREYGYRLRLAEIRSTRLFGTGFRPGFPSEGVRFFDDEAQPVPGFATLPTPGHRPEHTAFWHPAARVLISGDCLIRIGGRVLTENFLCSPEDQRQSLAGIRALGSIDLLCPGHGRCAPWKPA